MRACRRGVAHGAGAPLVTLRPPDVCKLRIFVCVAGVSFVLQTYYMAWTVQGVHVPAAVWLRPS